jgi:excinuclease UvrABC ATPase subunit
MSVQEALDFFDMQEIVRRLRTLSDVGLDNLTLGQPLSTLSGGECQRITLASELHKNCQQSLTSAYLRDAARFHPVRP